MIVRKCIAVAAITLSLAASAAAAFDLQGHRGARGHRPENTIAAFETAIAMAAFGLSLMTIVA